jgi:hypothetical protein
MSSDSESISRVWDACHRTSPATSYARSMDEELLVRVVRGTPTEHELAALITIVAARSTSMDAISPSFRPSPWTMSARPSTRPSSWRASAMPR